MISVIICTHNPREDYLNRVIAALESQTLPTSNWELLLIDNASTKPLAKSCDLSWHLNARHVREDKLGLTQARLRGIRESHGELLVFVDDDNVLSNDYLSVALDISERFPNIGAFGGSVTGEFEHPPPAWAEKYIGFLAISEAKRDYWSNLLLYSEATPVGAGLCIRRTVAQDYERKAAANPLRTLLDRIGSGMLSGGDIDLAWCAIDLEMGTGRFERLCLTHLIPSRRLNKDYMINLIAGMSASAVIVDSLRAVRNEETKKLRPLRLAWQMIRASSQIERRILIATNRERQKALKLVSRAQNNSLASARSSAQHFGRNHQIGSG